MSLAPALVLRESDRKRLANLARLPSVPPGLTKRARIVLLAAEGMPNAQIARTVGVSRPTVIAWRDRYQRGGIKGLEDGARSSQPAEVSEARRGPPHPLTAHRDDLRRAYVDEQVPLAVLAARYRYRASQLGSFLRREGIRRYRRLTRAEHNQIRRLRAGGMTKAAIARQLGVTQPTVQWHLDHDIQQRVGSPSAGET